jgi:excisionase family DNA binding protein
MAHRNTPRTPPAPAAPERLITIRETCERLTLSRTTIYRLSEAGVLPKVRLTPTRAAFRERDVDAFIGARVGTHQEGA